MHLNELNNMHLYPARHQVVCGSKDELLVVVAVWRGQDDLACPRAIGCGQKELLLGAAGRVRSCVYLALLTSLLVRYNLTAEENCFLSFIKSITVSATPTQPLLNDSYLEYATISFLYICRYCTAPSTSG
jgi:hypothetical protein